MFRRIGVVIALSYAVVGALVACAAVTIPGGNYLHLLVGGCLIVLSAPWCFLGVLIEDVLGLRYHPLWGSLISIVLNSAVIAAIAEGVQRLVDRRKAKGVSRPLAESCGAGVLQSKT